MEDQLARSCKGRDPWSRMLDLRSGDILVRLDDTVALLDWLLHAVGPSIGSSTEPQP